MPASDLSAIGAPLAAIVREAGELARATARQPFKRWTKGTEGSPVSEGDIAVNDFLYGRLSALVHGAAWLSEESHDRLPDRTLPLVWIVDPIAKIHSLALRIARVAQGSLEAAVASAGSHDWDLAAADLLVHEAGGALTNFAGQPLTYNEPQAAHGALVAASHERHAAIIELVRDRETEFA